MIRAIRWTFVRSFRSHFWITPTIVFALVALVAYSASSPYYRSGALGGGLALLFSVWLTVASAGTHPGQEAITAVAVGGPARLRLAEAFSASLLAVAYAAGGHILSLTRDPLVAERANPGLHLLALGVLYAVASGTGATVGALTSRPVIRGRAVAFSLSACAVVLLLAVPISPVQILISVASQDEYRAGDVWRLSAAALTGCCLIVVGMLIALSTVRKRG